MCPQLLLNNMKFAATLTAPGLARCFVEHELRAWMLPENVVDDAKLVVTELVTNSVEFTGFAHPNPTYADLEHVAIIAVQIRVEDRSLFVEVWDNGQEARYPPPLREEGECGRGLTIVRGLAVSMGHGSRTDGQLVWAELDAGPDIAKVPQAKPVVLRTGHRHVVVPFTETTRADLAMMDRLARAG
jgi:anti-sigma regulatory factor (Ser/Thr protein kinase)